MVIITVRSYRRIEPNPVDASGNGSLGKVLSEERVNILSATVTTTRDRVAVSRFTFELADPAHLGAVLQTVRNVEGVFDAYRVTSGA